MEEVVFAQRRPETTDEKWPTNIGRPSNSRSLEASAIPTGGNGTHLNEHLHTNY